jgi:hypothetical protein
MKRVLLVSNRKLSQRGQSLVETALFFPIFIIMLAGLIEISHLLITQNRVSSAARASTRFLSNGGTNEGTGTVVLNTVTQTLEMGTGVWDIWAIRGKVNNSGDAILDTSWEFEHVFGDLTTERSADINQTGEGFKTRVLDELQLGIADTQDIAGIDFVGTFAIHDVESILGLDVLPQLVGMNSIESLSIMRVAANKLEPTAGCTGFPIAVHEGVRSVTAPGSGGADDYPAGQFDYPDNPEPEYERFINHVENVPLAQAEEGYLYLVQNGFGDGNFGWLRWNTGVSANANRLEDSLTWPGNSNDYTPSSGGQGVPGSGFGPVDGFIEPTDPTDHEMQVDDWVAANTGSINASFVRSNLQGHIDTERQLRLIVWDQAADPGSNGRYHISGFAIFRLIGYSLSQNGQNGSWILAEFIRWDNSCGQVNPTGP